MEDCADTEGNVEGVVELTPPPSNSLRIDTPAEAGGGADTVPSARVHQREPAAAIAAPRIDFARQQETLAKAALLAIPGKAVKTPQVGPADLEGAQSGGRDVVGPTKSQPLGGPYPSQTSKEGRGTGITPSADCWVNFEVIRRLCPRGTSCDT